MHDLFELSLFASVVHVKGDHWLLVAIDPVKERISIHDSLPSRTTKTTTDFHVAARAIPIPMPLPSTPADPVPCVAIRDVSVHIPLPQV